MIEASPRYAERQARLEALRAAIRALPRYNGPRPWDLTPPPRL